MKLLGNNILEIIQLLDNTKQQKVNVSGELLFGKNRNKKRKKSESQKKDKNIKILRLISSMLMLIIGIYLLIKNNDSQIAIALISIAGSYFIG